MTSTFFIISTIVLLVALSFSLLAYYRLLMKYRIWKRKARRYELTDGFSRLSGHWAMAEGIIAAMKKIT